MGDMLSPGAALLMMTAIIIDSLGFIGDLLIATGLGAIPGVIISGISSILGLVLIGGADFIRIKSAASRAKTGIKKMLKKKAGKFVLTSVIEFLVSAAPMWTIYTYDMIRSE